MAGRRRRNADIAATTPVSALDFGSESRERRTAATDEAHLFARYCLPGVEVDAGAIERYVAACQTLFVGPQTAQDLAIVDFVRRHPWSLRFLDATAACLYPRALLRKKLLLMLALLETTRAHAQSFVATPRSRTGVVLRLLWWGGSSGGQALVGLFLWPLAKRTR